MAQKPRRDRRRISQVAALGGVDAGSEPFGSDLPLGSGMETAAIGEVTPAMMDEAAHAAAEAVEAAAHHVVIQAGHDDPEHEVEPVPHAVADAASVSAMSPDARVFAAEPDPSSSPQVADFPMGAESLSVPSHDRSGEATPALPPREAIAPSAPVEAVAIPVAAEDIAAGDALAASDDVRTLLAGVPTSASDALDSTSETLRRSLPSPGGTIGAYGAQMVEMLAANMAATGQFLTALMGATSVTEVVAVNTDHLRRQMELLTTQGRQLTTLARTITLDAMKPFSPS